MAKENKPTKKEVAKNAKKDVKKNAPKKRRFQPKKFVKNTIAELKRVTWPTRKELLNYTLAVIVFVIAMGVVTFAIDFVLLQGFNLVV